MILGRVLLLLSCCLSCAWSIERLTTDPDLPRDVPTRKLRAAYDFIVVGAGPGGATIANRLTEVSDWTVLLLEAGGDELRITNVPAVVGLLPATEYNWGYRTEPQENACLGLKDRRCICPRGKGMGGSSLINYMMYTRGHPSDYDGWDALGNAGWAWRYVLNYFMKSENADGDFATDSPFHSKGGYLDVQRIPYRTNISQAFLDAASELGHPIIDYNADSLLGFSRLQVTMRNGSRCSASKAFLRPIRNRSNLHVAKRAQVTKILIDPDTRFTYGVEFHRDGKRWSVNATREVIISAGAINTPQLLMLSGIGPREHLESRNITVVHELPGVGQNLQDHVQTAALSFLMSSDGFELPRELLRFQNYVNYSRSGEGIFAVPAGMEALGFIRTSVSRSSFNYPDIAFVFSPLHLGSDYGILLRRALSISDSVYNKVWRRVANKRGFTIIPILIQPSSVGRIELRNSNPLSPPKIFANYLDSEHDVNTLVEGIKFTQEMVRTRAFQRYNARPHTTPIPRCEHLEFASDDYWRCAVRQISGTAYHPCCTAKMGLRTDPMAVVDPQLQVHGVLGLRVVDASVMPRIVAGHTMAPTYMIAEKAADHIKSLYGE